MQLRPYQHQMIEHICSNKRCNLFVPPGLGKTVATLTALDNLSLTEDIWPVLVLAPLRVAKSVWKDEVAKWPHLRHLKVSTIVGTPDERRSALNVKADLFCINYDNLVWLIETLGDKWRFKTVVADECSKMKSMRLRQGGKRAGAFGKIAHVKVSRYLGLTGTPCANSIVDLWALCWFVDQGVRLGRSFSAFQQRWFKTGFDGFSLSPFPHSQKEIEGKIKDICLSINPADHFPIKDPVINKIYVDLPPAVRKKYKEMEKEFFTTIEGNSIEAANAAVKSMKLLQFSSGCLYLNDTRSEWGEVHTAKIEALEDVVEESMGNPIMVAYNFKSDKERILKKFPKAVDMSTDKGLAAFRTGGVAVGFCHAASLGHGVDGLQNVTNTIVFFGYDWNLENHMQLIERVGSVRQIQAGRDRNTILHYIITKDTIDELVLERLEQKRSVQDILLEAMKKRKA